VRAFVNPRQYKWLPWLISVINLVILSIQGASRRFTAFVADITERKGTEAALRENETQMRLFMEATTDCIWNWDLAAACITRNAGFERLFGYAAEEIIPTIDWWTERLHPDDRERVLATYRGAVASGRTTCSYEYRFRRRDGSYAVISDHAFIVRDDTGKVLRALGAMTDITERKRAEESLRERARLSCFTEEVSLALNRDMPTDEILRHCVEAAVRHLGAALARIWTVEPGDLCGECHKAAWCANRTRCLHLKASAGLSTNLNGEYRRVPLGTLKIGRIAQGEGAMFTNDVLGDERLANKDWLRANGLQSFAGFPLIIENKVFGVMGMFARVPLSDPMLQTLESICNGIAATIARKQGEKMLRQSEVRFRTVVRATNDAVWEWNFKTNALWWGDNFFTLFGYRRDEVEPGAESWSSRLHPDEKDRIVSDVDAAIRRKQPFWSSEYRFRRADGSYAYVHDRGYIHFDESGTPVRMTGAVMDITERKRAEEGLALFRTLLDNVQDSIEVIDPHTGRFIDGNEKAASNLGYTRTELLSLTVPDIDPLVTKPVFLERIQRLRETGGTLTFDSVHRRKDGTTFPVEVSAQAIRYGKEYVVAIVRDITERKRAEESLRESERRFRTIFDQAPLGMAVMNSTSGQFRRINRKFCEIVGYQHKEMLARTFQDITHPDDLQADLDNMTRLMEGRIHNFQMEKRYIRKDGAVVWVNLMCVPLWWDDETEGRFHIAMVKDITERKQAEEAQRRLLAEVAQSRNHFEAIFRSTPSAISITTLKDGRFLEVNESAARLTGYSREELLGRTSVELGLWVDPDERPDFVRKLVEKGQLLNWERQVRTKQGEIRDAVFCFERIQVDAEPCLISIAYDITERKRAEAALRERSRQQTIEAELSLLAVTAPNLPYLLNAAIKLVADVLGTEHCAVLQLLPNGKELLLQAGQGWKEGLVGHATMSTGFTSLAGYALLSNVPVVVEDFLTETRFKIHPLLRDHGIVSGMSFIIHGKDEPWGALGAYTPKRRSFSRDDVDFFRTVCNILATAIERMQTEDVLRSANQTLRTLSRQLLQVQEEDRRMIARDLHDEIGQSLTAIKLNVERAQRTSDRAARGRIMTDCVQITDGVLNQVRNLSLDLHPSILDDLGLSYALKWYADRQAERAGLNVEVTADPSGPRLPQDVEIVCFRIAQEALTNVVRHAQASRASIILKRLAKRVELRIQDDGVGFDVRTVQSPMGSGTSIGLTGMRERARLVGGEVHVRSVPRKGTEVTAIVPLPSVPSADTTTTRVPPS
jgi:PAS domain S-box-containing protein